MLSPCQCIVARTCEMRGPHYVLGTYINLCLPPFADMNMEMTSTLRQETHVRKGSGLR